MASPSDKSLMKQILESFDHQTASYSCLSHLWKERLSWILQLKPRSKTTFPRSKSPDRTIPFQVGFFWRFRGYHSWWCHHCKKTMLKMEKQFPEFFWVSKNDPQKMWSHHRLVPFDLLVKNLRLRFLPSLPKASKIFCWERSHIPFFIRYFESMISLFPRWHIKTCYLESYPLAN